MMSVTSQIDKRDPYLLSKALSTAFYPLTKDYKASFVSCNVGNNLVDSRRGKKPSTVR